MEHLVEHMRTSYHSVHEPTCRICKKHCRSFESLREHLIACDNFSPLTGPLPKEECKRIFSNQGCKFCLVILNNPDELRLHQEICQLPSGVLAQLANLSIFDNLTIDNVQIRGPQVAALACKMVGGGGGSDGSLDPCARVCLIDEYESMIFHTYVKPPTPATNYRYQTTGIRAEYLSEALLLSQAQRKIQDVLYNREPMRKLRPTDGKASILVGHTLDRDLSLLQINFPATMMR
ncbi:hypothetical protein CMV_023286 [Castanea mollissima]|uniref:RNA exonuclease 4 n=1 Tax=Castanea mollissima TaxID=60419 RepID=A0A8J4QQL7_9ROSI|nr:hypothetical protein CMV_023286 [Castanea mollissima]